MIICKCNEVTFQEIRLFLKKNPHATLQELQLSTKASTSCGRCSFTLENAYLKLLQEQKIDDQLRISF